MSRRTFQLAEQGQVTDRYAKAIEKLGSKTIDVTIGGIYALERIARDSPKDHPTVMEVLAACIREHSREQWPKPPEEPGAERPERATRPDIQAALTVIGRRDTSRDIRPIDVSGTNLTRANLTEANLTGADLTNAWWPRDVPAPAGWQQGSPGEGWQQGSFCLKRADANSGDAQPPR